MGRMYNVPDLPELIELIVVHDPLRHVKFLAWQPGERLFLPMYMARALSKCLCWLSELRLLLAASRHNCIVDVMGISLPQYVLGCLVEYYSDRHISRSPKYDEIQHLCLCYLPAMRSILPLFKSYFGSLARN
ncbi:hypothetical protein IF1G_06521 [Cordyceps javanica]|uniref:Uncharacterized protein n=1 Tax=Cordyceps javanica TaxID=43265 RepID=A0A545UYF4_9HYPO|nr:hypothetical protein IF1G_06521 [Cordyceps javanica]